MAASNRLTDSPARYTDQMVQPAAVEYSERPGYSVVRTPTRPDYWFGNLLVLSGPLVVSELAGWASTWDEEFTSHPLVRKRVIQWHATLTEPDGATLDGLARAASALRFELVDDLVMVLEQARAPAQVAPFAFRAVGSDGDWRRVAELEVEVRTEETGGSHGEFVRWQTGEYRARVERGGGQWWAAFDGAECVGAAGVLWADRWARFQQVTTRSTHRRRGIAGQLCHHLLSVALAKEPGSTVVVVAGGSTGADRVYHQLGFRAVGVRRTLLGDPHR